MHQLDISLASLQEPQSQLLLFYLPIFSALTLHLLSQFREPGSREIFWPLVLANIYQSHFIKTHWNETLSSSILLSLRSTGIFVLTIWSSMLIYRLGFHRLNKFKGPLKFIASKWFMVPVDLKGQRPYVMQKLHEKYGDIVRIGPRELSINDPEALSAIYGATGPSSRALRGPFYAFTKESTECGAYNLQSTPTMSDHAVRRKNWDAGFSAKALRGYEECVIRNVNLTISQINKQGKDESVKIDVGRWCSWFGFDVMGELGFGKGFDMVKNATTCRPIELIEEAVVLIMAVGNVPYMPALLKPIPTPIVALERWARNALKERLAGQTNSKIIEHDVFSHILGETKKSNGKELSMDELTADAGLLVVAGSDTSSNTMCLALFHLIHTPGAYARLQEEIEHCFPGSVADDLNRLGKECDYLNAVIQETLRLWPPVASGLQRITPPEGIPLKSGVHIPGGIVVSTPTYVMHRDPRNFSHPNEFRPDRWMASSEETKHNVKAFSAFGFGPTGCIGKQVGLMELRLLIARFVQTFDAKFAPGFDPQSFMDSIKDCFVLIKDPCLINVKARSVELANAH